MTGMMWGALFLLVVSGSFFTELYASADSLSGCIALAIALAMMIWGLRGRRAEASDWRYALILACPSTLAVIVLDFPDFVPFTLLLAGSITYYIAGRSIDGKVITPLWSSLIFSGIVLLVQIGSNTLMEFLSSWSQPLRPLARLLAPLCRLCGLEAAAKNGSLYLQNGSRIVELVVTWDALATAPLLGLVLGAYALRTLSDPESRREHTWKSSVAVIVIAVVYAVLRLACLATHYAQTEQLAILWHPTYVLPSLLPLVLILVFLTRRNSASEPRALGAIQPGKLTGRHGIAIVAIVVAAASATGALRFQDPGIRKEGRILIDEVHSEWEKTTIQLNTEEYGTGTTYNYYSLAEWLDRYYVVERNLDEAFSDAILSRYDILILKCPTRPYAAEEVEAVVEFVKRGGGLWLIGDHTNVFGMNTYLNPVASRFGIRFRFDSTHALGTDGLTTFSPPDLLPHPIVQFVQEYHFMTSCSLQARFDAEGVMIGTGLTARPGDYSDRDFFQRAAKRGGGVSFGAFIQLAAVRHGDGRVVAFTDSTCFSNFSVFMDGNPPLILGTLNYLNRRNSHKWVRPALAILSLAALATGGVLMKKLNRNLVLILFLCASLFGFFAAATALEQWNRLQYKLPPQHTDMTRLAFESELSQASIQPGPSTDTPLGRRFNTFFVWTQRIGLIPIQLPTLTEALQNGDAVVLINPSGNISESKLQELVEYVDGGGRLLLIDSIMNSDSCGPAIAAAFGIGLSIQPYSQLVSVASLMDPGSSGRADRLDKELQDIVNDGSEEDAPILAPESEQAIIPFPRLVITGGDAAAIRPDGTSVAVTTEIGSGIFAVLVDSYAFSDAQMVGSSPEISPALRSLYELEFLMLESILRQESRERR